MSKTDAAGAASGSLERAEMLSLLDGLLEPQRFKDYGPNGLQVEGRPQVAHVVSGVTACLALIDAAIEHGADAILVHHGLFWRGQDGRVTGWMKQRLSRLLQHDINLFAYHLPLDAHPVVGNNARLGRALGLLADGLTGDQNLVWLGRPEDGSQALSAQDLAQRAQSALGRAVTLVGPPDRPVHRVGWCTGGAQSAFDAAISAGVDAYVTGELSEPQTHWARESGVAFLACGHHATERLGVAALGDWLAARSGIRHTFVDIPNPA